jgi:imidazolonepropionase-like amidohydrolase
MARAKGMVWAIALLCGFATAHAQSSAAPPDSVDPAEPYLAFETGPVLIADVELVDGTGSAPRASVDVLIADGHIAAVGEGLAAPAGTRRIDGTGLTLIPGIVGAHNHTHIPGAPLLQRAAARLYLANGVTTIRTVGAASPLADLAMAQAAEAGVAAAPRVSTSSPYVSGPGDAPVMVQPSSGDEARAFVRRWADIGVGWIKLYRRVEPHIAQAVIDEAHAQGLLVAGHLCSLTFAEAAAMGIDTIEHGLVSASDFLAGKPQGECIAGSVQAMAEVDPDGPAAQAVYRALIENGTALVSTLAIVETRYPHRYQGEERIVRYLAPAFREAYDARQASLAEDRQNTAPDAAFANALRFERAFFEAGGLLAAGLDPGRHNLPGFGDQRNYALFLEAGFSPEEAVQVMTLNGAIVIGRDSELGSVEPGKRADLALLDGSLSSDPSAITRPVLVFRGGQAFSPERLLDGLEGQVGLQ